MKYNLHDILNIETNLKGVIPEIFLSDSRKYADIEIKKIEKVEFENGGSDAREISPGILVSNEEKKIIARFVPLGLSASISLQFSEGRLLVCFTSSYGFLSDYLLKMPVASLYPLEHFLKLIIQIKLLEKNFSYFISAGIAKDNEAILISSFGGIGKTTTCLKLLESNPEWKFLGDDTLMTDGKKIFAYTKNLRIRKLGNSFFSYNQSVSPERFFQNKNKISLSAEPKKLFFLERGPANKVYKISSEEALTKYKAISRKIMPIASERMLLGAYYENYLNLSELLAIQDKIADDLIGRLECFVVEGKNASEFSGLINEKINEK